MFKVLIATGGTGGHLFPAQQLQKMLSDCDVLFAGHKLASSPFFDQKMPHREITSAGSLKQGFKLLQGFFQSLKLLFQFKPDVVVGFGSFHSFPILLAAVFMRKKIVIYEANCSLGKVNRFFAPFACKAALHFPIEMKNAEYVRFANPKPIVSKETACQFYGLDPQVFTLLVFGGSQGAQFINKTFCAAANLLHFPFQVIHLTGKEDPEIKYQTKSIVKAFEKEMSMAYCAADLVVSRCGAGTVRELIHFQKPSLLIPYPFAYNHQKINGEFLQEGAKILIQSSITPTSLAKEIHGMKEELELRKLHLKQIQMPPSIDFGVLIKNLKDPL